MHKSTRFPIFSTSTAKPRLPAPAAFHWGDLLSCRVTNLKEDSPGGALRRFVTDRTSHRKPPCEIGRLQSKAESSEDDGIARHQ